MPSVNVVNVKLNAYVFVPGYTSRFVCVYVNVHVLEVYL